MADGGNEGFESASAVQVTEVSKRYPGAAVPAVDAVSFAVSRGEFFTLLGPSGCGKTTTLRLIAGLEAPDTGEISFRGRTVANSAVQLAPDKRDVGMVFQSGAVWPHMTVKQNVSFPLKVRGVPRSESRERVAEMLNLVGLPSFGERLATSLSGGQLQRVALARALVTEPSVLLLDEPFSSLDSALRVQMRLDVKTLQQRLGITTVLVTHDRHEALRFSDCVAVMRNGALQQIGPPQHLYRFPVNEFVRDFLGETILLQGTIRCGQGGDRLIALDGARSVAVRAATSAEPGTRVLVALRPDDLVLESAGEHEGVLAGTVDDVQFVGNRIEYRVGVEGQGLLVVYGDRRTPRTRGQQVSLRLHGDRCTIWPLPA